MDIISIEILKEYIMPYVGNHQFRFVAGVSRTFYEAYVTANTNNLVEYTVTEYNLSTMEHAKICYDETRSDTERCHLCVSAARHGSIPVLRYLKELLNCPWDVKTCSTAAKFGHLQVLQWARQHGCDWNEWTCINAAQNGHLHILQWASANGFGTNMSQYVSSFAANHGQIEVLKWLHSIGCPFHETIVQDATASNQADAVRWLRDMGYLN
jgi:Ankyrin repeats (many copies)